MIKFTKLISYQVIKNRLLIIDERNESFYFMNETETLYLLKLVEFGNHDSALCTLYDLFPDVKCSEIKNDFDEVYEYLVGREILSREDCDFEV